MAQPGLHALLAVATRKTFSPRRWFALGLAFGSLIPDADLYAQAFAFVARGMAPATADRLFHRTFTHSLFFALALWAACYAASWVRGGDGLRTFGAGLALGVALLHTAVDVLTWFDGVGVLWPIWEVNLWAGVHVPEVTGKLLGAGNFYACAAYLASLGWLARRAHTRADYLPRLWLYTLVNLALGIVFTALAFGLPTLAFLGYGAVAFLGFAYPNALWVTWQMRGVLETDS